MLNQIIESFFHYFDLMSSFLNQYGNWYITLFIYALIYKFAFSKSVSLLMKPEIQKRAIINKEIDEIKERFELKGKFFYNEETEEMEKMRLETKAVLKKHKPKPFMLIGPIVFQGLIFMLIMFYTFTLKEIEPVTLLPYLCAIITFFTDLTRKTLAIRIVFSGLVLLLLLKAGGGMHYFYLYYVCFGFIVYLTKMIRNKQRNKIKK